MPTRHYAIAPSAARNYGDRQVHINVYIPKELHTVLNAMAANDSISLSAVVKKLIASALRSSASAPLTLDFDPDETMLHNIKLHNANRSTYNG